MKLTLDQRTASKITKVKNWQKLSNLELARTLGVTIEAVQFGKKQIKNR